MKPSVLRVSTLVALGAATLPETASAAGGGGTFLGLPSWIWLTANLLLFLWILRRLIAPPLTRFLDARGEEIRRALRRAASEQQEARELRENLTAKLAALEHEVEEIRARAAREGEREKAEILAQAERERDRMLAQAREEIAFRVAQARHELAAHTAALAAQLAEERLERDLTPADRERVFQRNLTQLAEEARS
jgi:ATP synthase F0 subunit b